MIWPRFGVLFVYVVYVHSLSHSRSRSPFVYAYEEGNGQVCLCVLPVIRLCETASAFVWACCVVCGGRGSVFVRVFVHIVPRSNCVSAWSRMVLEGARGRRGVWCAAVFAGFA